MDLEAEKSPRRPDVDQPRKARAPAQPARAANIAAPRGDAARAGPVLVEDGRDGVRRSAEHEALS
jgi:hypothetical protein